MNRHLISRTALIALTASTLLLAGCAGMSHRQENAATGAAIGAVAGAGLIGHGGR